MIPIDNLLSKLLDAKKTGSGWSACCPAHDDQNASLSIAEGDDGRVLVNCHAGCTVDAVCQAIELTPADLFVRSTLSASTEPRQSRRNTEYRRHVTSKPVGKTFTTAADAIAELERRQGPQSDLWTYRDARGEPVGLVVRWNLANGKKDIRPVSKHGAGWRIGGMPEPRLLYELPDFINEKRVYIVEGEKAAEAARSIGLTATTSPHGTKSADKADWSPLAGKEIVILPDNDGPGRQYAETVTAILAKLKPPPAIKVVELPELPDHGDIADFVQVHAGADPAELRRQVEALADAAEPIHAEQSAESVPRFVPFPVLALPKPVREFVVAGAKAIGCDMSYLALPILAALAAAIGNTRRIQLKQGWTAPAILWVAIIGESGTAKTPAFQLVMRPIRERQRKAMERHANRMQEYDTELARWEKAMGEWRRDRKSAVDPPEKPEMPQADRFTVSDTTVEALAPILLANPRGLLLARDELAGWIGSFDRYSGGKSGADASQWLSMYNGDSLVVDRKTGTPRTIYVQQASVSVCGGIQPVILDRALGIEHRESGLAARLLLACPPRKPKRWSEDDIDPRSEAQISWLIERLYGLEAGIDANDNPCPVVVGLTPDAKVAWKAYYNAHAQEQTDMAGELSAAWSKLEEYAARLALVIHLTRWAADDPTLASDDLVDAASIKSGIALTQWFKGEDGAFIPCLAKGAEDRNRRRLVEWIDGKGGAATAREVQMGCRWLKESGAAEAALNGLAKAGFGCWRDVSTTSHGGRPTRVFTLTLTSTINETSTICEESVGSVDVDSVEAAITPVPECEWGEL